VEEKTEAKVSMNPDRNVQGKEKWTWTKRLLLVFIIIMIGLNALLGYQLIFPEEEEVETTGAYLLVDKVYFGAEDIGVKNCDLDIYMFITNEGDESCIVRVWAFVVDVDSNLAMDDKNVTIGTIEGEKTKEASVKVNVPRNGRYVVKLVVFKDGKITVKGKGTVDLRSAGGGGEDYHSTEGDDARKLTEPMDVETPSLFTFLGVTLAICAGVIYLKRRGAQ